MAKGKHKTEAKRSVSETEGKKKARRGLRSENNDKHNDGRDKGEELKNNTKPVRISPEHHEDPSNKHAIRQDHVAVDQKTDEQNHVEKHGKKRERRQASKKTSAQSHVPKVPNAAVSEMSGVAGAKSGKDKSTTDLKMDKEDSKPAKKKQTMNAKEIEQENSASKHKKQESHKDPVHLKEKSRHRNKLDNKTGGLDETDGDIETSEYFSSDSGKKQGTENDRKRKRKHSGESKTMSSKVKHLKTLKPDLDFHNTSKIELIQSGDNDSSDSDFEEVPDITIRSPPTSHSLNIKKETGSVENKVTVKKDEKFGKKSSEVKAKGKAEKSASKGNKDGRNRKSDLKRNHDVANIDSKQKMPVKKRKQDTKILSAEDEMKSKVSENKSDRKTAGKTEVNKKKASNSKNVKNENRKSKQNEVKTHEKSLKSIDHSDVTALLLHMEGPGAVVKPSTSYAKDDEEMMSDDDDDDDDEGDWEDVEDHHGHHSPVKSQLPDKPVEITLDAPVIYKKRKKREFDIKAYFQRQINKYKRELNISMHKVHLLCLLSRGFYLNSLCMDETLEAQAMSITMTTRELKIASVKSCDVNGLFYMTKWMKEAFPVKTSGDCQSGDWRERLENSFQQRSVTSRLEFVLVCVILLRQLGFLTRLVMSLQPLSIRTVPKKETNSGKKRLGNPAKIQKKIKESDKSDQKKDQPGAKSMQKVANEKTSKTATVKRSAKTKPGVETKNTEDNKNDVKTGSRLKAASFEKSDKNVKTKVKERNKNIENNDSDEEVNNNRLRTKNNSRRSCASKVRPNAYVDNDDDEDNAYGSEDDYVPNKEEKTAASADADDSDIESESGDDVSSEEEKMTKIKNRQTKKEKIESSDGEFAEESFQVRTQSLKKVSPTQKNKKALSSDSGEIIGATSGADEWVEVFLQREQRWICLDCVTGKLDKPYSVEHNATPPVHYVVGFCEDGTIKDVTARYASQWLTTTRKFRGDEEWWAETVDLYKPVDRQMDEVENREIQSHLLQRPLPTSIAAFKSHPLYALKRHLLKFEAVYPETAVPLGYIRGEPVYARECVHVLHSRENWLKEGRAVRVGEEPYKHVKSRPKWNKPKENPDALDLEVFGRWQTEVYIPPPAVDGKVPRNAHGNVELFLPSMLPAGTVHLQIEGLNKVAKKLDIDCAPAMVGWDHHCGFSHPRMDGWIVCEEFKDILLAAWDEEQEIIREKEQEKREKRVYSNWKLLIKGLLIKERLKKRFDLEEEDEAKAKEKTAAHTTDETKEKADDYKQSWPQNRLNKDQKHFDVEKL